MNAKYTALMLGVSMMLPMATLANITPVSYYPNLSASEDDYVVSDWDLSCDNAGTCRAVGYHADDWSGENQGLVSMLLKRKAGGSLEGFVRLNASDEGGDANGAPELFVVGKSFGKVAVVDEVAALSDKQLSAITEQFEQERFDVVFRLGQQRWMLSGVGLKPVLRKMDEVQGYTGTVAALLDKGARRAPTTTYYYPKLQDKPVLSHDAITLTRDSQAGQKLYQLLRTPLKDTAYAENYGDCAVLLEGADLEGYHEDDMSFRVQQIATDKKLVTAKCWWGAYNSGDAAWVVNDDFTKIHQSISTHINGIEGNQLFYAHKARGIGDCWSVATWTWDGNKYVQSYEGHTGQCRGFAWGAWDLPYLVVDVASDKDDMTRALRY